ncbi:MAG: endoflagellar motor protein [Deltaproteobacteria bacterium]|nr:endoflagellar motor protein [Deltaproteobacteria bacterium]
MSACAPARAPARAPAPALALCCLAAALGGCVRASTHDALSARHAQEQQRARELDASLKATHARAEGLGADKASLEAQLAESQRRAAELLSDKTALKNSVEEMQAALQEQARRQAEVEARVASFRSLLARFKPLIDTGKLKVKIVDGRMVLVLATDVLFAKGSADLSEEGAAAVTEVAEVLASMPPRHYQVEGHTDNDPIATKRYPSNWELAADRALRVVKAMVDAGLPVGQISGASYGEAHPAAPNDTPEQKAQNRRIEVVMMPDLSQLPGFDELQRLNTEG